MITPLLHYLDCTMKLVLVNERMSGTVSVDRERATVQLMRIDRLYAEMKEDFVQLGQSSA